MMGEAVVLGWLALELTDSPLLVGVAMGMRGLPFFFAGVPAGALADRVRRHRLLIAAGAGQALATAALGALALTGTVTFGRLLVLTFAGGTLRAVEHAARQGYVHDVVGPGRLVQGLAVLGVGTRVGWLAGSLGTGTVIAVLGIGAAYLAVAASHVAGVAAILPASAGPVTASGATGSLWRGVLGFLAAVRDDRGLLVLMGLTAGAEILGFSHQVLLPSLARDVLRIGPDGLGLLNAARSVGGILALAAMSSSRPVRGGGPLLLAVLVTFGASLVALGVSPHVVGVAGVVVVLVVANAAGALADLLSQSLLQLGVPEHLRGRAGGAWVVAIGLAPLGQLQIGALASLFGVGLALGTSGLALVALAGAAALAFPRLRRL